MSIMLNHCTGCFVNWFFYIDKHTWTQTNYTYKEKEENLMNDNKLFRMWCSHVATIYIGCHRCNIRKRDNRRMDEQDRMSYRHYHTKQTDPIVNCQNTCQFYFFFWIFKSLHLIDCLISIFHFNFIVKMFHRPKKITKMNPLRWARILNILHVHVY